VRRHPIGSNLAYARRTVVTGGVSLSENTVWDHATRRFLTRPDEYTVYVGNSADNTPHTATLTAG
jgi:hypothetical protein